MPAVVAWDAAAPDDEKQETDGQHKAQSEDEAVHRSIAHVRRTVEWVSRRQRRNLGRRRRRRSALVDGTVLVQIHLQKKIQFMAQRSAIKPRTHSSSFTFRLFSIQIQNSKCL